MKEYGFPRTVWQLCPEGWKKLLGDDWEDVRSIVMWKWSPETYLSKERKRKNEKDLHYQFNAQAVSFSRRFYKEHGMEINDLQILKSIYLLYFEKRR